MTRDELIAAVPVHEREGRTSYVDLDDIPQPWRDQFLDALYCSQCPKIDGVERAAYAWDWECWVHGGWYGRQGPTGLDPEPDHTDNMHALHLVAVYPVLAALARERTEATRLDGRTCRFIYEAALHRIDWQAVRARERDFMRSLGIEVKS